MKELIADIFSEKLNIKVTDIIACGNHELKRNWVYCVYSENNRYIIKLYGKANRQLRELNAFKYYQPSHLHILASGSINEIEYSIYNFLEGDLLDNVFNNMIENQREQVFYNIGIECGKLHSAATFDFFGDWVNTKQSPLDQYKSFLIDDLERMIGNIISKGYAEDKIIKYCIETLRSEYDHIKPLSYGVLCHRDLDGRNILLLKDSLNVSFLDFEKCVISSPNTDLIGFMRKYFITYPELISPFFKGYCQVARLEESFFETFRFNVYRLGIDLISWSEDVSKMFYVQVYDYLKWLYLYDDKLDEIIARIRAVNEL